MSTPDDRVEQRLRAVTAEADPVPDQVLDDAKALFALRDLDAELAELVADSLVDDPAVLTRALVADVRMLSFVHDDVTIDIDIDIDPVTGRVQVHGVVSGPPGSHGAATLVRNGERRPVVIDEDGHFDLTLPTLGPMRLELARPDGGRVTTTWITP